MFATHLKLISVFNYLNFPHTIFIALFNLKYSHSVQIEQKMRPFAKSNKATKSREIKLQGHPTTIFEKKTVLNTICDLEFSEYLL